MKLGRATGVVMIVRGWSWPALAQEEKVGLTMGYPTAVGVLWQVSDLVAIRPEFTWAPELDRQQHQLLSELV